MDLRTLMKLACSVFDPKEIVFEGVKHNAVDDCYHQIKIVHESLLSLGIVDGKE